MILLGGTATVPDLLPDCVKVPDVWSLHRDRNLLLRKRSFRDGLRMSGRTRLSKSIFDKDSAIDSLTMPFLVVLIVSYVCDSPQKCTSAELVGVYAGVR